MKRMTPDIVSTFGTSSLALLVVLASQVALAQENGWYGGISGGEARAEMKDDPIVAALRTQGYSTSQLELDYRAMTAKIFGGYSFNRYFAVEGGYFDHGDFDYAARVVPFAERQGEASINGFSLDLVGTLPLGANFSAFARACFVFPKSPTIALESE